MPRANRGMTRYNVYIPDNFLSGVRLLAGKRGLASADIIRQAIREHLTENIAELKDVKPRHADTA